VHCVVTALAPRAQHGQQLLMYLEIQFHHIFARKLFEFICKALAKDEPKNDKKEMIIWAYE
jgi:hypothetical protein